MKHNSSELVSNRKAFFHYEIIESYEAGVVLTGTEVKSLRSHDASLQEAYVKILGHEIWLVGCYIAPYTFGNVFNHEPKRERKLLMHRKEIIKLKNSTQEKGFALIPLSLYLKKGRVKLKLAIAKGKKSTDKRETIREREEKREMDRMKKRFQ